MPIKPPHKNQSLSNKGTVVESTYLDKIATKPSTSKVKKTAGIHLGEGLGFGFGGGTYRLRFDFDFGIGESSYFSIGINS